MRNNYSYDRIARKWVDEREKSFVSKLVKGFADKVSPKGKILDIGCGSGYLSKYLAERNFQVEGIDTSERMIKIAKSQKIAHTEFITSDFFDFVSPKKFDGVIAWDSFFHFPKEKQQDIYFKVESLLNIDGYLLFTHGDADDEHIDEMMGEPFYYSCIPKEKVCNILSRVGFKIEYVYKDFIEGNTHRSLVILAKKVQQTVNH